MTELSIAEKGRRECTSLSCTRRGFAVSEDGRTILSIGECMGYHCSYCGKPCSMMGHYDCPAKEKQEQEATDKSEAPTETIKLENLTAFGEERGRDV